MFLGEYQANFTGQGRLVLPKKFRAKLAGSSLVLSRGFEGCIWGFSLKGWEDEALKQLEVSATERQARDLRRYLFSAAEEVGLDDQGRFVIPKNLLGYAKLKVGAVLVGAGDHFEIWNPANWQRLIGSLTEGR